MAMLAGLPSAADACGNWVSAFSSAARASAPKSPPIPSGRYTRTNPLRREAGLRLLSESLPEPLRWALMRAWRRPSRYASADHELPQPYRQRPDDLILHSKRPGSIGNSALLELELARRVVEAPQATIRPATRNAMLSEQSVYLRRLYDALAWQIGETNALADFERLIGCIV